MYVFLNYLQKKSITLEYENICSYLPISNLFTHLFEIYLPILTCSTVSFIHNFTQPKKISKYLNEIKPTIFSGYSNIWKDVKYIASKLSLNIPLNIHTDIVNIPSVDNLLLLNNIGIVALSLPKDNHPNNSFGNVIYNHKISKGSSLLLSINNKWINTKLKSFIDNKSFIFIK